MANVKLKKLAVFASAVLICSCGCTININVNNSDTSVSDSSAAFDSSSKSTVSDTIQQSTLPSAPLQQEETAVPSPNDTDPFYGVWVGASKDRLECEEIASQLRSKGFEANVYDTLDWNNLNSEHWYVVTAGKFVEESTAQSALNSVIKAGYADAYVKYSGDWNGTDDTLTESIEDNAVSNPPFYGIWVAASKDRNECSDIAADLVGKGYAGAVYDTLNWSNLNSEHWYVVSAGEYATQADANSVLDKIQAAGYPDAYVKYSGNWQE